MLALHPRQVASPPDSEGRVCYCVVVACVSLLLFVVLAAAVSVARACAITAAVALLLALVGWLAPPTGPAAATDEHQQQRAPAVRLVHHRCACGLPDATIAASLPAFAYDGSNKEARASSVLCAVCLEDVRAGEMVRQLPACRHLFHAGCVDAWLRAHRTCPLCRRDLSPHNATAAKAAAAADDAATAADALPPV